MNETDLLSINFEAIVQAMNDAALVDESALAIIGGQIDLANPADTDRVAKIVAFLAKWKLDQKKMPYAIWETVAGIDMLPAAQRPEVNTEFRRARIFGEDGDLSLRVDGDRLLWHFIGKTNVAPPIDGACDFWQESNASIPILRRQEDQKALLWGKHNGANRPDDVRWVEDRVRVAELNYPGMAMKNAERVHVVYDVYWDDGQPVFYRLRGLEAAVSADQTNGGDNGEG